jgi:membrane protease YdiL (CAAX protease family)
MEPLENPSPGPSAAPPFVPRRSIFREVRWRWRDVLIGLAPLLCLHAAIHVTAQGSLMRARFWLWPLVGFLSQGWSLFYPVWVARVEISRLGRFRRLPRPRAILVGAIVALPVATVVMAVQVTEFLSLNHVFGDPAKPAVGLHEIARLPNRFALLGLAVLAMVVAPVAEEIFFRGMLYNALRQRLTVVAAALLQAGVFSFFHNFGPAGSAAIALAGLAFAFVYEWRKTLVAPILLHLAINTVGLPFVAWGYVRAADAPRLGVYGETHKDGCRITAVVPETAADKAGLRVGDVIMSLDGQRVKNMESLTEAVRSKRVGQQVAVEFRRGGTVHQVDVILTKLSE